MKKHNLFKVLGIVILAYCVLTWIIPGSYYSEGLIDIGKVQIGIFSIFQIPIETISYFYGIFIFILLVGGFYGLVGATDSYKKLQENIVEKFKGKEKLFLIVTIVTIAVISSITGLEFGLFFIFPFFISIILLMGHDKLTALAATLGATIIGMFGNTYGGAIYSVNNQLLGQEIGTNMLVKVVLFIVGLGALILFTLKNINKEKNVNIDKKVSAKKANTAKIKKLTNVKKDKDNKPLIFGILFGLMFIVMILGTIDWSDSFGVKWFTTAYDSLMAWEIGGFAIFGKIFEGLQAFGTWIDPTRFTYYSIIILMGSIITIIINKIKFSDAMDNFFEGAKGYLGTAFIAILAYSLLIIVSYYPIFLTVGDWIIGLTDKFNVVTSGIVSMLGSVFYVDVYYYPKYVVPYLMEAAGSESLYSLVNILFVSLYSVTMLVAPTGVLLLTSLSLTKTNYKEWLKYIWKLFLALVIVAFIVLTILSAV